MTSRRPRRRTTAAAARPGDRLVAAPGTGGALVQLSRVARRADGDYKLEGYDWAGNGYEWVAAPETEYTAR